jgi:exoribonuclease R
VLAARLAAIRDELSVPHSFSPEVEEAARESVAHAALPQRDLTDVPFVTIDPPGSTDLDQALFVERVSTGYRVLYAIADVPAFVSPGGALDAEARRRGQTLYAPTGRVPLHPTAISEHAASLREGERRGAFVWTLQLDGDAGIRSVEVYRAAVRSRHRYSYAEVQALHDSSAVPDWVGVLREVGERRELLETARGGASLNRPEEEVELVDGRYTLVRRRSLPVEGWNAQLSLMTGMAAAKIMIDGKVGILRTMPMPAAEAIDRFRAQTVALGCPWPESQTYGEYLRALDQNDPRALAVIHAAASLFRGAGYTAFDGEVPKDTIQAAVAAPYAHATAPLRRLVDRFVLVTCAALAAGEAVPAWVRKALPAVPGLMSASDSLASRLEHNSVDAVEAALLSSRIGERFRVAVLSTRPGGGVVQLADPVVTANIEGDVKAGESVLATLTTADIATGAVLFSLA